MAKVLAWAVVWLVAMAGIASSADRVAFIVGNQDYVRLTKLKNTLNDVEALKKVLEGRLGFKVIYVTDAQTASMAEKIEDFGAAATDAEVALFYYAGHAVEFNSANLLMPVDFDDSARASYINQTTRLDEILMLVQMVRAKTKILVVDACRAYPFASEQTRGAISLQLSKLPAMSTNTLIVFSTQPGKMADDGAGRHSPFAEALLAQIETPGLDVVSMFQSVTSSVTQATGGRQVPWLDQNFMKGQSVYLGSRSGAACDPADKAADRAMCKALVNGSANTASMQSYLACYPQGMCREQVQSFVALGEQLSAEEEYEVAAAEPADGLPRGVLEPYAPRSYWDHRNSVLSLADNGTSRILYYEKPRQGLVQEGVTPGTVLFKGVFSARKMNYSGEAYLFSKKCGPIAYRVEGKVSPDYRHVTLKGNKPVRNGNCRRTGTKPDVLQFDFISTKKPG